MFRKLVAGNDHRISRLHDRKGQIVPMSAIAHLPHAITCWVLYKIAGWRSRRPWISYEATKYIERKLSKHPCTVLEFGSGMSTLYFADRAKKVCSIEHDENWYQLVRDDLVAKGYIPGVVEYHLAIDQEAYYSFKSGSGEKFDIILVDGPNREKCIEKHLDSIDKGGCIYLDNTDAESSSGKDGEMDQALEKLLFFASEHGAKIIRFTDFAPGCLFATEGYLVEMPKS